MSEQRQKVLNDFERFNQESDLRADSQIDWQQRAIAAENKLEIYETANNGLREQLTKNTAYYEEHRLLLIAAKEAAEQTVGRLKSQLDFAMRCQDWVVNALVFEGSESGGPELGGGDASRLIGLQEDFKALNKKGAQ